ncbi:hypothetical protein V1264_008704 [Littorina saxatilis]|uniref:Uncharacterized protein n=1 Tax=Littorina saxatilis TaxID=31220 RepID=A0AAN9G2K6_9CAEN
MAVLFQGFADLWTLRLIRCTDPTNYVITVLLTSVSVVVATAGSTANVRPKRVHGVLRYRGGLHAVVLKVQNQQQYYCNHDCQPSLHLWKVRPTSDTPCLKTGIRTKGFTPAYVTVSEQQQATKSGCPGSPGL